LATREPTAHLALFPYLLLGKRVTVGPYELIPRNDLRLSDYAAPWIKEQTEGLLRMYVLRSSVASSFGAVARACDGHVGDPFPRDDMARLRRAVVVALLDRNPENIGLKRRPTGWSVPTSDHALFYVHQLNGSGHVVVQYGRMVEVSEMGLQIGDEASVVRAPVEVHGTFSAPDLDELYADATYQELKATTPQNRRLARSIDWLDVAWRNTPSITDETRILALYSGFETLLYDDAAPDQTASAVGAKLARLLERSALKMRRSVPKRPKPGQPSECRVAELTDLEWWFVFFAFLRNDLTHGNAVEERQNEWNDQSHLFLGETRLRQAIKHTVAEKGHAEVLLSPFERISRSYGV
jgi:hypothetical protein